MVHQHFKLVDTFTVLQNIILGEEPLKEYSENLNVFKKTINYLNKHIFKIVDYKKARTEIEKIITQYNLHVDNVSACAAFNVKTYSKKSPVSVEQ